MSKSENLLAFEAALKESRELQEAFETAKKRIAENKEAASDSEMLAKAAAEVGYTLSVAEIDRVLAEAQEISDEDLETVSGGTRYFNEEKTKNANKEKRKDEISTKAIINDTCFLGFHFNSPGRILSL